MANQGNITEIELLETYRKYRQEIETLMDEKTMFLLGLINELSPISVRGLLEHLRWPQESLIPVCQTLHDSNMISLEAAQTNQVEIIITPSGRNLLGLAFQQDQNLREIAAIESMHSEVPSSAKIKVIGVGGGGGNAINRMIDSGIDGVQFLVANTDLQALRNSKASVKIQLGEKLTRGLGVGGDPELGRQAALEDTEKIIEALEGSDMVFITAGLGGGTGTGAGPIIGSLATELGALTVAVVTKPFVFEGHRRMKQAEQGLSEFQECVDTTVTISNERLLRTVSKGTGFHESFRLADDILFQAVLGITAIITVPGLINVDFADVKTIMQGMGVAFMGTGSASGENRLSEATKRAISSPLLEEASIQGARNLLVNITGGDDLTLSEIGEAMSLIHDIANPQANIIFGAVVDDRSEGSVRTTVIATGFGQDAAVAKPDRKDVPLSLAPPASARLADPDDPKVLDFNRQKVNRRKSPS